MFKAILKYLRFFFGLTRRESKGLLVLVFIMILIYSLVIAIPYWLAPRGTEIQISFLEQEYQEVELVHQEEIHLFPFDPNSISRENLQKLGVGKYTASNILKYREKGGVFRSRKDFSRIYGVTPELYQRLERFINLPEDLPRRKALRNKPIPEKKQLARFDINKADTTQLMQLRGVGPVLSGRIVKYRNMLGGYVRVEQVAEVYNLSDIAYQEISRFCFIEPGYDPRKIMINKWPLDSLRTHPYISYYLARSIVNYRAQHGVYHHVDSLKNLHLMNDSIFEKVSFYIEL